MCNLKRINLYFYPLCNVIGRKNNQIKRNKFSFSVGLIVFDHLKHVYILERTIPYCIESKLMKSGAFCREFTKFKSFNLREIKNYCKNDRDVYNNPDTQVYLNRFEANEKEDDSYYEDNFDIPHGQSKDKEFRNLFRNIPSNKSIESTFSKILKEKIYILFKDAQREWNEETKHFITNWSVETCLNSEEEINCMLTEFLGCDGYVYTQLFFLVILKNNQKIIRANYNCGTKFDVVFKTCKIPINLAISKFQNQDNSVNKHSNKSYILYCANRLACGLSTHERYKYDNNAAIFPRHVILNLYKSDIISKI